MAITITMTNGQQYLVTRRDIRRAVWTYVSDQDPREIMTEADAYGRGYGSVLTVFAHTDTGDWSGYETDALRVRDAHGTTIIPFSAACIWSEGGRDQYCVAHYEDVRTVEDEWGDYLSVRDLLDIAGLAVSREDVDYTSLAEEFIDANPGARYFVNDERGFANEWTLHVRVGEGDDDDDLREITVEDAVWYLATAVMEREDYEATYHCECAVGAVLE